MICWPTSNKILCQKCLKMDFFFRHTRGGGQRQVWHFSHFFFVEDFPFSDQQKWPQRWREERAWTLELFVCYLLCSSLWPGLLTSTCQKGESTKWKTAASLFKLHHLKVLFKSIKHSLKWIMSKQIILKDLGYTLNLVCQSTTHE